MILFVTLHARKGTIEELKRLQTPWVHAIANPDLWTADYTYFHLIVLSLVMKSHAVTGIKNTIKTCK